MAHFSILHQMQPNLRFEDGPGQRGQVLTFRFWLNSAFERDAPNAARFSIQTVRRAWHVTLQVRILLPGFRRAEN